MLKSKDQLSATFAWFSCERKIKFNNEKAANVFIKKLKKRGVFVEYSRIYKCPLCGKFHVTKNRIFKNPI